TYEPKYYEPEYLLSGHRGVCAAVAQTYAMLLDDCGVHAISIDSDDISHQWVMAEIDGNWYHCDPTWDDSRYEQGYTSRGHYNDDHWDMSAMKHKYFLLSDEEIGRDHTGEYTWAAAYHGEDEEFTAPIPKASVSDAYADYFFKESNYRSSQLKYNYVDGYWYYMTDHDSFVKVKCEAGASNAAEYTLPDNEHIMWVTGDEKLLYILTQNTIYAFDPAKESFSALYTADTFSPTAVFSELSVCDGRLLIRAVEPFPDDNTWSYYDDAESVNPEQSTEPPRDGDRILYLDTSYHVEGKSFEKDVPLAEVYEAAGIIYEEESETKAEPETEEDTGDEPVSETSREEETETISESETGSAAGETIQETSEASDESAAESGTETQESGGGSRTGIILGFVFAAVGIILLIAAIAISKKKKS
ncbi:MAG: hypothetical protein IJL97_01285, partial [Lachnospiraceae bacterium]|nr:hypothetical protein [Lachnospiraceae bacterium]